VPLLLVEEPNVRREESYRSLVQEFVDRGERLIPFVLELPNDDFPALVDRLSAFSRGESLPAGFVPHSTLWLVRDDADLVGVSNFRHRLTDSLRREGGHIGYGIRPSVRGRGYAKTLLAKTLERAVEMGLVEVLLTCAKANMASVRTIVRNGGVLMSEEFIPERGEVVQRYTVGLSRS
jgi:predicted acetyltransferase